MSEFGTLKLGGGGGDGVIFSVLLFISLQRYVMKSRVILTEYFTVHVQKKKRKNLNVSHEWVAEKQRHLNAKECHRC